MAEDFKNYNYNPESVEDNAVHIYVADDLMDISGMDTLRIELGYTFSEEKFVSSDGLTGKELKTAPVNIVTSVDQLRDFRFCQLTTKSPYIESLEIMPSRIEEINSSAIYPNFKIPVRMYGTEGTVYDDQFWRILFTGGSYGMSNFKSLMNTSTVFSDFAFTYANAYTTLYAKSIGIHETCPNISKIQAEYLNYNLNTKDQQDWVIKQDSPLLQPNYYIFHSIAEITDLDSEYHNYRQLCPELQLYCALSASYDTYGLKSPVLAAKLASLGDKLSMETRYTRSYLERTYFPQLRATDFSQEIKNKVVHAQRNIIMPHSYFNGMGAGAIGADDSVLSPSVFPYYNIIQWPRHGESNSAVDPTQTAAYDGLHRDKCYIRDSIEDNSFSSKFLESLKDIHQGTFPGLSFGNKKFKAEYSGLELIEGKNPSLNRTIMDRAPRTLDFVKMIQMMYNNPEASLDNNYTFVGLKNRDFQTTYDDNKLYRYYDNSNMIGVLNDVHNVLKDTYDLKTTKVSWGDEWSKVGGEVVQSGDQDIENSLDKAKNTINFLFNCNYAHAETLAYRVEKTGGSTTRDYTTADVIQDYWIWNSSDAPQDITLYDTQVKYDENYTYKVYAYVAVVGKRYMYRDFRLTKQIGTLDAGPDGAGAGDSTVAPVAPDGDPEYYCLQFYDPVTGELADQLFNLGDATFGNSRTKRNAGLNLESAMYGTESIVRGSTETSALAQRNQYANDSVDISEHPFLADFHLYVEPCVKIVEIPLFKKKLKILDNPANDMVAIPFQYMDDSKQIGFNMRYESFDTKRPYPVSITKKDIQRAIDYHYSKDLLKGSDILLKSKSPQRYIEVYRTDKKPTKISDFENRLVDTIDLKIEESNYTYSDTFYKANIPTNKKFYYVFRFISENLVPGHMSQILECELVDDGDYIYSKFDVLADQLGEQDEFTEPSKKLKKVFQIEPNLSQIALDISKTDFSKTTKREIDNLEIGDPNLEEKIWDQKFKIRLSSKKTGKEIDFNIQFILKDENRMSQERGSNLIYEGVMSQAEFLEYSRYLLGASLDDEDSWSFTGWGSEPLFVSTRPGFEGFTMDEADDDFNAAGFTEIPDFDVDI